MVDPKIEAGWKEALWDEFQKEYFKKLRTELVEEYKHYTIFPKKSNIFAAFDSTPFQEVKAVILGQDPYHGPGQAHGLSFSVMKGVTQPPSLKNIFKELQDDLGFSIPIHGNLSSWAKEGVLLLNTCLTVRQGQANSHKDIGWQHFTDAAIHILSRERKDLVFLLWGNQARKKLTLIDTQKHCVLESVHPSPFAARNGFFGCKHFSKTNDFLISKGKTPINWEIK